MPDLLISILWSVEQEQVSHEAGAQDEMRAAIRDHPFYTEMVLSHLKILKVIKYHYFCH